MCETVFELDHHSFPQRREREKQGQARQTSSSAISAKLKPEKMVKNFLLSGSSLSVHHVRTKSISHFDILVVFYLYSVLSSCMIKSSFSSHLVVAEVDVACLIPAAAALLALESLPLPEEKRVEEKT